ncbi:Aste57867_20447 [Aphanomyces stellatus]|uniref:Aste57867_20447 protein n=1 Tax=Aphanomyces stellatus TaxID=120398 RepID=A0A485LF47_9STRA|nr:hypothetical protein As57867_020381 [Aphanomyces stellatus]VFT97133.1 Aste57867_20447 [Aphanomyces stellatus]
MAFRRETPLTALADLQKDWEKGVAQGTGRLTQIANANQKVTHADGESWGALTDAGTLHLTLRHKLEREAHQSWKHLSTVLNQLVTLIAFMPKMRAFCCHDVVGDSSTLDLQYNGCPTLSRREYGCDCLDVCPISRDLSTTETTFQSIIRMYEQELMAKAMILHAILDCHDHDTAVVYIASWQMQPYLDKTKQAELLALLAPPVKRQSTQKLVK